MKNLAGDKEADLDVERELHRCGIEKVDLGRPQRGEVPTRFTGKFGPFTFERAWYYWIVSGPVPLAVAERLYAHPVGRTDVRAGGYAGGAPPSMHVTCQTPEGRKVGVDGDGSKEASWDRTAQQINLGPKPLFVRDLADVPGVVQTVDTYHIDSELGLYLFVQSLKEAGFQ